MKKFLKIIMLLTGFYLFGVIVLLFINSQINSYKFISELQKIILKFEKTHTKECLENIQVVYKTLLYQNFPPEKIKKVLQEIIEKKNSKEVHRYIFVYEIYNINGGKKFAKMLINPNVKNLEGKFLDSDFKDVKGKAFREEMLKIARSVQKGFITYYYLDPLTGKVFKKLTYMIYLPKIHWIVASGIYMNYINGITEHYKKCLLRYIFTTMAIVFGFMIVTALIIFYWHKKLLDELQEEITHEKDILTLIPLMDEDIMGFNFDSPYLKGIFNLMEIKRFGIFENGKKIFGDALWDDKNAIRYRNYHFVFEEKKDEYLPILNHIASIFYLAFNKKKYEEKLREKIKRQIEEIKQKDRELILKEKTAALGEVVGNIAHQWKQPLNAISNVINNVLLDIELGVCDKEGFRASLREVHKITKNMACIIDIFKNLYKISGKKELITLKEVFDNVFLIFDTSDVKIHKNIKDCEFLGYLNELEQVILTILSNAKDEFKRKNIKGEIFITSYCDDKTVRIEIEDNAGGVPEELKEKIFKEFFSTKDSTGLGLAFSKKIIEQSFKGKIWVENTQRGAKFIITFLPPPD
ncbi:MAG: ATP-binding protein [Nautiliaceae bacterium]